MSNLKVDSPQVSAQPVQKINTQTRAFTASLKEGDRVMVDVLSSDKGAVVLKTENGQIFKAKLDTDAELSQGDRVLLEYSGKEGKLVFLSIMGKEAPDDDATRQAMLVRDFGDKSLAPFAAKLADLRMTVSEENARVMREVISQYPGTSVEDAAFIASNKIGGEANLVKAALAILSNGEKTDAMIERLIALLGEPEPPDGANARQQLPGTDAKLPNPDVQLPARIAEAPLTNILKLVTGGVAPDNAAKAAEGQFPGLANEANSETRPIIPQSDSDMQSRNVIKSVEILQNEEILVEKAPQNDQKAPSSQPGTVEQARDDGATHMSPGRSDALAPRPAGAPPAPAPNVAGEAAVRPGELPGAPARADNTKAPSQGGSGSIAELLSGIPEFRGTPPSALERFSNMLLRIAKDADGATDGGAAKLASLLDSLFTRVDSKDAGGGERLRAAREELFARLSLFEETIARAAPQIRAEMLEQTQKLIDHVRLLNSIDQFVYLQLPVQMGEERKTAELYMFRRKNGKRADPENTNILLALDLENLGHWEGLINIRNKDVSVRMEVRGEAEKDYFIEKTVILHELLAEAGFKLAGTTVSYSREETTPLTALAVFDKLKNSGPGIDVTV